MHDGVKTSAMLMSIININLHVIMALHYNMTAHLFLHLTYDTPTSNIKHTINQCANKKFLSMHSKNDTVFQYIFYIYESLIYNKTSIK